MTACRLTKLLGWDRHLHPARDRASRLSGFESVHDAGNSVTFVVMLSNDDDDDETPLVPYKKLAANPCLRHGNIGSNLHDLNALARKALRAFLARTHEASNNSKGRDHGLSKNPCLPQVMTLGKTWGKHAQWF
jgi:hypothetical protein